MALDNELYYDQVNLYATKFIKIKYIIGLKSMNLE